MFLEVADEMAPSELFIIPNEGVIGVMTHHQVN
jgi:hypothetical protein